MILRKIRYLPSAEFASKFEPPLSGTGTSQGHDVICWIPGILNMTQNKFRELLETEAKQPDQI